MLIKGDQHADMLIRQRNGCWWGMSVNSNQEMLAGYADPDASYPDAS